MKPMHYLRAFNGIVWREFLRFLQQRERFFAALVRPLVWLIIFAAGFRAALGISIIPPYQTYITYDVYITPGLVAMIQLFNGMQTSLSMVYDREMGSMRVLLTTPLPRWFLLVSRLFAGVTVSLFQVYTFLLVAYFFGVELPPWGYLAALPALILTGMMFGALGMLVSSTIKQLENFAGIMNFVIFPDVLRVVGALSAMEDARGQPVALLHLHLQPLHLCGRADPFRLLSRGELAGARRGARLPARLRRAVGVGLRPVRRHPAAQGRRRRSSGLRLSRWRNWPDGA